MLTNPGGPRGLEPGRIHMQSLSILIAQADARVGELLAASLRTHFRETRVVRGLHELQEKDSQNQEPCAVVVDLELANFQELHEICSRYRSAAVICTHRLADDEMWVAALAAGATDCCTPNDIAGILRAVSGAWKHAAKAA
jgi:DNA-binding NtrC family response regulator